MTQDFLSLPVRDVMTEDLITVRVDQSLEVVDHIFQNNEIHHLPVMKDNEVVGIISHGDMLLLKDWGTRLNLKVSEKINRNLLRSNLAEDIMSANLVTVPPTYTLAQCASLFKENRFRALPVVSNSKLVGLITTYDLLVTAYTPVSLLNK